MVGVVVAGVVGGIEGGRHGEILGVAGAVAAVEGEEEECYAGVDGDGDEEREEGWEEGGQH